jgi:hypothetical protein
LTVAVLGPDPAGLPQLRWPTVPLKDVPSLAADAAGLALFVFTRGTLTVRSFAAKSGYRIDVDYRSPNRHPPAHRRSSDLIGGCAEDTVVALDSCRSLD